ncbi:rho-related BTB domain-containing protein 1 [Hydra vulgaris]|uniref:Rho-related BTB domain-containing protein 1 n=1 Tax=Hydra vulgaris TaxID=6087 RepID=T2MIG4_HYDVU|nr:rho-related BTB domain-containing protein 1 [Hydra vulgaris]
MDIDSWPASSNSFDAYDNKPSEEFIKCVVVGDTAVGKTRLICSYIFDQPPTSIQSLHLKPHIPTVFAIDQYVGNSDIRKRGKTVIDGVNVELRIWDTFGDHEKDRKYAYENAHVVVVCFSIGMQSSLINVNAKWVPEIKKYCPRAAIVLVGTQLDRRYTNPEMYKNALQVTTLTNILNTGGRFKLHSGFSMSDIIYAETARQISKEIKAACYIEVSVVSKHGVNAVFENSIRAALILRRNSKLILKSHLKNIKTPHIQEPYLPPCPEAPDINILAEGEMFDFSCLHSVSSFCDIEFIVENEHLHAHSVVLISADEVFQSLLMHPFILDLLGFPKGKNIQNFESFSLEYAPINGVLCYGIPRGFSSISVVTDFNLKRKVTVNVSQVTAVSFRNILEFVYCGSISNIKDSAQLLTNATYLQLSMLCNYLTSSIEESSQLKNTFYQMLFKKRKKILLNFVFNKSLYSDISFSMEGALIPSHKPLLVVQCNVMAGMFRKKTFKESITHVVDFSNCDKESFMTVLEYLYTCDLCNHGDLHNVLQLANFLCLPRLITLCELELTKKITEVNSNQCDEACALVLDTFIFAKFHNAVQLSDWCLYFMASNYNKMCQYQGREMKALDETTKNYLEKNRWPPVWYLKDQDLYERCMQKIEKENTFKISKERKESRCFSFFKNL